MPDQPDHDGILVGVDGSANAKRAVQWAARSRDAQPAAADRPRGLSAVGGYSGFGLATAPLPEDVGQLLEADAHRILDEATRIADDTIDGSGRVHVTTEPGVVVVGPHPCWI